MQQPVKSPEVSLTMGEIVKSEEKDDHAFRTVELVKTFQGQFDELDLALQVIKTNIPHLLGKLVGKYIDILTKKANLLEIMLILLV